MLLKLRFLLIAGVLALGILHGVPAAGADTQTAKDDDTATVVICNVIRFVQKLGLPIMT